MKLKDSVKSVLVVSLLSMLITIGLFAISERNNYLEQQKKTEMNNQVSQN